MNVVLTLDTVIGFDVLTLCHLRKNVADSSADDMQRLIAERR